MSGQPYRYAKDVENFRNEYMESLGLRANIDNMNLQVNKNYKETGALPPQSSMKDMRTTSEILADTEKLKLSIISEFKDVATPNMMQIVLQKVQTSPLNGDGSFLIWMAQNAPEIVSQLKKKYKFGIEGNANDAEQMYLFMQNIFSKTKEMNSSIKSVFDRPTGGLNGGLQTGELDALKAKYADIVYKLVSKNTLQGRPTFMNLTREIRDKFERLTYTISTAKYDQLKQIFNNTSAWTNNAAQIDINRLGYSEWIEFTDKLPSSSSLNTLLDQLQKSEKNANSELSIKILNNINSILPTMADIDKADRISDEIIATQGTIQRRPPIPTAPVLGAVGSVLQPPVNPSEPPQTGANAPTGQQQAIMNNFLDRVVSFMNDAKNDPAVVESDVRGGLNSSLRGYVQSNLRTLEEAFDSRVPRWRSIINYNHDEMIKVFDEITATYSNFYYRSHTYTREGIASVVRFFGTATGTLQGAGIKRVGRPKGSGIVKPLHERIDNTKGVKQGHTHVPFGKYIINKNRLDEDILSFKHNKGYGVKGYPAKKISRNLSNVLKVIVGGGVPKFDDLASLSENEKSYLHTVSKKAGITDKISVPTPSKDSMEQDVHQFEVMKGEILAGNDSSVLIKKFKLLLLKLSKNGTLPKREATEILEDLLMLGF
jgi:hypothetical protein